MPLNSIDALLSPEFMAALRQSGEPGQSYQMNQAVVRGSGEVTPAIIECHSRFQEAGQNVAGSLSAWLAVSADRERIMGEVILQSFEDAPLVIWDLGKPGQPTLQFKRAENITFPSHVDLAEAMMHPESIFQTIDPAIATQMLDALSRLGYRLNWKPQDKLNQSVEAFDLITA